MYLKVSPMKGIKRFSVKGKLAPRYIGPFKVLDRKGKVAYQLELLESLSGVHDVFMCLNSRSVCMCLRSKYLWKNLA